MQMGAKERAKTGQWRGGPQSRLPFGYKYTDGMLRVDDYEAMIVKYIYDSFLNGIPLNKIQNNVLENYPLKQKMKYRTLAERILKNNIYIGKIKYAGETYDGIHEPIIDVDTYEKAQAIWKERNLSKKKYFQSKYLLTGMVFCSYCGAKMASTGAGKLKCGERIVDYICYSKKGTPDYMVKDVNCPSKRHRINRLDPKIIDIIKNVSFEDMEQGKDSTDNHATITAELKRLDSKIEKLLDLYQYGLLDVDILNERITNLNIDKERLQFTLDNQKKRLDSKTVLANIKTVKDFDWNNSDYSSRREMVRLLITRVELGNEDIKIEWNI